MQTRTSDVLERRIAQRAMRINESTIFVIAGEARRMQAQGIPVVSLSTGEPDFATPDVIKQAAIRAINEDFTHYTPSDGIGELRAAIAEKLTRENDIPSEASDVIVSVGGKHAIFNALAAILDEHDEVLIPSPYWVSYPEMVKLVGGAPVIVETSASERYKVTPEALMPHLSARTRAIIINSPSNPTGVMYTRAELEALGSWAASAGLYVISDELYEKIVYDGRAHFSIGSMPELADLAITINGVSKAYAMTGWRIGYMRAPQDVLRAASRIQSQVTSNTTSISQVAALAAIQSADADASQMRDAFETRRDLMVSLLREIEGIDFPVPDGAFYVFVDVSEYFNERYPDSEAVARMMLADHHVAVIPGSAFGDDRCIRLSYACSEANIRDGVARVAAALRGVANR